MAEFVKQATFTIRLNPDVTRLVNAQGDIALTRLAQETVVEAVKRSPFEFGTNRRSLMHDAFGAGRRVFGTSGYSGYLEVGTSKMSARPYIRPALEAVAARVKQGGQTPALEMFPER